GIRGGEVEQVHIGCTKSKARNIRKRCADAEVARSLDDLVDADFLREPYCGGIARAGECVGNGDVAAVPATVVLGLPAVDLERGILYRVRGGKAFAQSGQVDE